MKAQAAAVAVALHLVGEWRNVQTTGLDAYLKFLGAGWAKRKVALAFRPELSFAVVDGTLQLLMPSPIGDRLEKFPFDKEVRGRPLRGTAGAATATASMCALRSLALGASTRVSLVTSR